jgi:MYXO-CTERM domain-containing protein
MKTIAAIAVLAIAGAAQAQISVVDLGTGAPPATVGPYAMIPFGVDNRPIFSDVLDVTPADGAPTGPISFDTPMSHRQVGNGWATWSHGYTGDMYYTNGALDVTIAMPAGTAAFYMYAEPDPFDAYNMTVVTDDGNILTIPVVGNSGANGFGFWTAGAPIATVTISADVDFAIGEFGIAQVPTPGAAAMIGLGGLAAVRRRR